LVKATSDNLDQLYAELVRLLCQEPFINRLVQENAFKEYQSENLQACNESP
jgi:hypothetical protein